MRARPTIGSHAMSSDDSVFLLRATDGCPRVPNDQRLRLPSRFAGDDLSARTPASFDDHVVWPHGDELTNPIVFDSIHERQCLPRRHVVSPAAQTTRWTSAFSRHVNTRQFRAPSALVSACVYPYERARFRVPNEGGSHGTTAIQPGLDPVCV
jgi:hypothetical protein